MNPRRPTFDDLDVVLDFFPPEAMPEFAYGLVKRTYTLDPRRLRSAPVQPLFHDIRRPSDERPRWSPGSDFWPTKTATDVAVRGSARAPEGRPTRSQVVHLRVGDAIKSVAVFGDRSVTFGAGGRPRFGAPEPYLEIPMVWSRAYGGWDPRVPYPEGPTTVAELSRREFDHPGAYPRNPFGRGYVVVDAPCEGIVLPNLEDPEHLLAPETLITGDPRRWFTQPLPACLEFTNALMFHRLCWLGGEAWFHPPEGTQLAEIAAGVLPRDFHRLRGHLVDAPIVLQEGAIGQVFAPLAGGTPIVVEGMSPDRPELRFALPAPPHLEFELEGTFARAEAVLTNVLVEPDHARVSLTYVARLTALPRVFIPGIHAKIPLALEVDGLRVEYETPPTVRELRRRGMGLGSVS
ncbi:MAG: DUF2169 domain-containing protein [Nannocystaceae bacterium]